MIQRHTKTGRLITMAAVGLLVTSCHPTSRQRYERNLSNTGTPALHAVHSDRLRELMAELNKLMFSRMPQELDIEHERQRYAREIAQVTGAMAAAAQHIPDVLVEVEISHERAAVFKDFADNLEKEALVLKDLAEHNRLDDIPEMMNRLVATCNACHSSFRILPVVTEAGRNVDNP